MKKNVVDFGQAERNARQREIENDEKHKLAEKLARTRLEFEEMYEALHGEKPGIYTKKKQNANVAFAQIIQHNLQVLVENNYLTGAEESLILKLSGYLEFKTNCLVEKEAKNRKNDDKNTVLEKTATPSYIARIVGCSRTTASLLMNSLKQKGVLATAETGMVTESNRVCTSRTWIMNPNIIFCGDKSDIDPLLQRIFKDSALNNITTKDGKKIKLPVKLFV